MRYLFHHTNVFISPQGSPPRDNEAKPSGLVKNARVSPFEEETPEDLQQMREQEHTSPQPKQNQQVEDESSVHNTFRYFIGLYWGWGGRQGFH